MSVILAGQGGKKGRCLRFKADPKGIAIFQLSYARKYLQTRRSRKYHLRIRLYSEGRKDRAFYYRSTIAFVNEKVNEESRGISFPL